MTGFVYHLTDGFKIKLEGRVDTAVREGTRRQLVYGLASSFDCHF